MLKRYFSLHAANLLGAAGRIARQPVASAMTIVVIAISLALPAGLAVFVDNAVRLSGNWQSVADISVYLELEVSESDAASLTERIGERIEVASTQLISRGEALAEFRGRSGFGEALDALTENPLPHTIVVRPAGGTQAISDPLVAELQTLPGVARVQLDTQWVARLRSMLQLVGRIVDIVTVLLAAAIVLVIGNTIRLEINNRSIEIEVMKLVGGTDGFIRRPFLYLGLWYGTSGALIAAILIAACLWAANGPAGELAVLYASDYELSGLSARATLRLIGGGGLLGWVGAWLASARHLKAIEPS